MSPPVAPGTHAKTSKFSGLPQGLQAAEDSLRLLGRLDRRGVCSLYLHVPFCFHKCHYCDFYSIVDTADRQDAFARRMMEEIRAVGPLVRQPIRTIFVGGGTPTLLAVEAWRQLLAVLHEQFDLSQRVEFTIEANPETVTSELISALTSGGVNRMSIGAQSFDPVHLKTLERWHDPQKVAEAVKLARVGGIANINLDLIFAIPGQSMEDWADDLKRALELEPTHLSCYGLTYEPNTPMTVKLRQGAIQRMDETLEAAMFEYTIDTLAAAGFEHYEISNFARRIESPLPRGEGLGEGGCEGGAKSNGPLTPALSPRERESYRCLHNLVYWTGGEYLAIGPSASGHVAGVRWKNVPHLGRYLASSGGAPIQDVERLDADARIGEMLMLRLRLIDGVPNEWIEREVDARRRAIIDQQIELGLLEKSPTALRLTRRGLMLADSVMAELV